MNNDLLKTKEQLITELENLRKKSKEKENELMAANQQLAANEQQLRATNQQLSASEQQFRASNQQLEATNQQLRASEKEAKLQRDLLLEAQKIAHISNWSFNPVTNIPWWPDELYKIYGLDPSNGPLSYEEHPKLVHPDDWEWFDAIVKETFETGNPYDIILRILRPNGEIRYVNLICKSVLDASGAVIEMRGTVQDVTERIEAEQKLKQSEEKFRGVFEDSNVGITIGSAQGDVIEVNDEYLKITGYTREEFVNINFAEITHPDDLEKELPLFEQLHKGEIDNYRIVKRLKVKSGGYVWLDCAITARKDTNGNIDQTLAVVVDVTEGKKAAETVNAFFDIPMNLHLICSIEGEIVKVNKGWEETMGYTKEESVGKNIFDFIHPDDKASTLNELSDLESGKTTFYFENRYLHKNGNYITLAWSAIFNTTGKMIYAVAKDITQQKAYHQKLVQSEERYKALSENAKHIIFTHNFDGEITYINQFGLDFMNLNKEQLIGTDVRLLIQNEADLEKMQQRIDDFMNGSVKVHQFELNFTLPSGVEKILEVIGSPILLNGQIDSFLLTAYDITEREKARLELAESELKLKNIIENSTNLFYSHSVDNEVTFISPQVTTILGYEPHEAMKQWTESVTDNPINKKAEELTEKAIKTGRRQPTYELEMQRKDGRKIMVEVREAPVVVNGVVESIVGSLTDITERKRMEEALKVNETNLLEAQRIARLGNWQLDNATNKVIWSEQLYKILGLDPNLPPPDYDYHSQLFTAESWERLSSALANTQKSGEPYELELEMVKPDGSKGWMLAKGEAVLDKQGVICKLQGVALDITERKQAEKTNQELLKRFELIGLHLPGVIYQFRLRSDGSSHFPYASHGISSIYGVTPEEVDHDASKVFKAIHPDDLEQVSASINHSAQTLKPWHDVYRINQRSGKTIWVEGNSTPIKLEDGSIIWHGFIHDITERKRAEENIKNISRRLQISTESANIGIWEYVIQKNILKWDKRMFELYGLEPKSFGGANEAWQKGVHPDDKPRTDKEVEDAIAGKKDFHSQFRVIWPSGELRHIEAHAIVTHDQDDNPESMIGVNWDITAIKNTEISLIEAKEKAEESDRLKSAFLSNMSHEIRTPMNGILGFTGLLKEPDLTGDERDNFILIIEKSGKRMLDTINDIVDISKIEAGQVEVSKKEVSVNKLLQEQFNFFVREAEAKGLELIYKPIVSDNDSLIITDQHKLESILTNLIKNAIKYTETGNITFGYALKKIKGKDAFEFYVKDTGIGIPENRTEAIFNRFEQADIEDTKVFEGSGLGLAISKSYVEMLGGTIAVNSEEGHGSSFTFSIPYIRQNQKKSDSNQNEEEKSGILQKKLSIIVAEDDEVSKLLLERILKNEFSEISYTSTGKETINKCRENPDTDIILMDIKMPDIDGFSATKLIREFNKDVIIIAQTAYGLTGDKEKALEVGCDGYIAKPIQKEKLLEKIQVCLNKKAFNRVGCR